MGNPPTVGMESTQRLLFTGSGELRSIFSQTASLPDRTLSTPSPASQLKVLRANFQFKFAGFLSVCVKTVATVLPLTVVALFCPYICYLLASVYCVGALTVGRVLMTDGGGLRTGLPWPRAKGQALLRERAAQRLLPGALSVGLVLWACLCVLAHTWRVLLWWWWWLFLLLFGPMTTEASLAGCGFSLLAVSRLPGRKFSQRLQL